jgi:hypothetical protein
MVVIFGVLATFVLTLMSLFDVTGNSLAAKIGRCFAIIVGFCRAAADGARLGLGGRRC